MTPMEEDKLKSLFSDFEPELSPDLQFLGNLERSMDSVEMVRKQLAEMKSNCRTAVAIASFAGFIVGVLFSLTLPYLTRAVDNWRLTLPDASLATPMADNFTILAWMGIAAVSVFTALNAYDLSLSLLKQKKQHY